jgi:hypothetical protein
VPTVGAGAPTPHHDASFDGSPLPVAPLPAPPEADGVATVDQGRGMLSPTLPSERQSDLRSNLAPSHRFLANCERPVQENRYRVTHTRSEITLEWLQA